MVGDKGVCKRWWVTNMYVKDGVCEKWCVKKGVLKMVCERRCVKDIV